MRRSVIHPRPFHAVRSIPEPLDRVIFCTIEQLEHRLLLSTVTVNSTADFSDANLATITMSRLANPTFNPDGQISLREAIRAARNTSGADTVELPAGTYLLGGAQLLYDTTAISNAVTIRAAGAAGSAIVDARNRPAAFSKSPAPGRSRSKG